MATPKIIRSDFLPYHLTARTNNGERFPVPLERVWDVLTEELHVSSIVRGSEPHQLMLMPNHFHLTITVPVFDVGIIMRDYMSVITKRINFLSGRTGRVFGSRYYPSLIEDGLYFRNAYKYVYRNPVRAGLCERPEDWKFSTLLGKLGLGKQPLPLFEPRAGFGIDLVHGWSDRLIKWLNMPSRKEELEAIRSGLRKTRFKLPVDRSSRRIIELEDFVVLDADAKPNLP